MCLLCTGSLLLMAQWRFLAFLLSMVAWSTAPGNHMPQQVWLVCLTERWTGKRGEAQEGKRTEGDREKGLVRGGQGSPTLASVRNGRNRSLSARLISPVPAIVHRGKRGRGGARQGPGGRVQRTMRGCLALTVGAA